MKKLLTLVLVAPLVFVGVAFAKDKEPKEDKKVTICHATSSEGNPWVRIVVSENAIGGHFDNPGTPKAGHEDDVLLQGDVACPVVETPEEEEEEPETPVVPETPKETPKVETPVVTPSVEATVFVGGGK